VRDDADFSRGLDVTANYQKRIDQLEKVEDIYDLATIKRRHNVYRANRRVLELQTPQGARMDIEFQVSNDGVAFRYVFPRRTRSCIASRAKRPRSIFPPMRAPSCSRWRRRNPAGTNRTRPTRSITSATRSWARCRRWAGRTSFPRCSAPVIDGCW
jgi:hypothetical protein